MKINTPDGLLVSVTDFTFGESVADPTLLTFEVSDDTLAQIFLNADQPSSIPLGSALIHAFAAGSFSVTATDNSSSGPQSSSALALRSTLIFNDYDLPRWPVKLA